jgi:hypothetical protein
MGGPNTIPMSSVKYSGVSSNSATVEATKIAGPNKSCMHQYKLNGCCNRAQLMRSLIDTGEGYHLRSSKYENRPLSTFPSGILHFPLVASPGLM